MTDFQLAEGTIETVDADAIVVLIENPTPSNDDPPEPTILAATDMIDDQARTELSGVLSTHLNRPGKDPVALPAPATLHAQTVIFAPVGSPQTPESVRRAVGSALTIAPTASRLAVVPPTATPDDLRASCEGVALGAYRFIRFRQDTASAHSAGPSSVEVLLPSAPSAEQLTQSRDAFSLADAVCEARDLVNLPPNVLYPKAFTRHAKSYLAGVDVDIEIWKPKALRDEGFGGLTAVGQGSRRGPRLAKLTYQPDDGIGHVALVGKGITFDSGGLSLKPAKSMEWMKSDMGGAAAVLATLRAVADRRLPIAVTGWLALAENMPGGGAQRPGDVITMRGGKTVEVLNTDAEGRLVLADAIVRAAEDDPDTIIDIATLTGAQMVALGPRVCGVMGNAELREEIVQAAESAGEMAWPMPLPPELRPSLDSPIADLANIGDRNGGMLTAGLFLADFVPEGIPWAHMDIAGPSWNADGPHDYTPKGGTGFAVRTLVEYLAQRSGQAV